MVWRLELAEQAAATSWEDITHLIDRNTMVVGGMAHRGEISAESGFDLANDAGDIVLPARRVVRVVEDAPTDPDEIILFRGRTVSKSVGRGTLPVGDANAFDVQLQDYNADLLGIVVDGWSRPAETDVERITALQAAFLNGSPRASTNLSTTYISADDPVDLPAQRYDDTNPAGVISDILDTSDKECFVTTYGNLFYDAVDSTAYAASIAISDDGPDDETVICPEWDGMAGDQDGTELISGLTLKYPGGAVTRYSVSTETTNDYWHESVYDEGARSSTAGTRAGAIIRQRKVEETRYRCKITLRADQVHLVRWGQTLAFRAAAAGILTPLTMRVVRLMWKEAGPGFWTGSLELSFPKKLNARIKSGPRTSRPPIAPVPFVPGTPEPDLTLQACNTVTTDADRNASDTSSGLEAVPGETWYYSASNGPHDPLASTEDFALIGPSAVVLVDFVALAGAPSGLFPTQTGTFTVPVGGTGNFQLIAKANYAPGTITTDECWRIDLWRGGEPVANAPSPSQQVTEQATGDGSTTEFQTNYPYTPNSISVKVGGVDVIPTQTDPTTGTFTLPFAPATGVPILITYQAVSGAATGATNDDTPDPALTLIPDAFLATDTPASGEVLASDGAGGRTWVSNSTAPSGSAGGVLGGTYPNPSFAADMATQAELDAHTGDTTDAHDASAVSIADAGGYFTGTDVEAALQELGAGGGGGGSLTVEEVDGSPTDSAVTKLVLPNGTLGIVGHVATYTPAAGATIQYGGLKPATPLDDFNGASLDAAWAANSGFGSFATTDCFTQALDGSHLSMGFNAKMGCLYRTTTNVDQEWLAGGLRATMPDAGTHMFGIAIVNSVGTGVGIVSYNDNNAYLANITLWKYSSFLQTFTSYGHSTTTMSNNGIYDMRLTRVGNSWTGYISANGQAWVASASSSVTITAAYRAVGLFFDTVAYRGRVFCDWVDGV